MRFLRNRTVLGVLCVALSLFICFVLAPLFNRSAAEKIRIVRVVKEIKAGEKITADRVQTVEVGGYNLPQDVQRDSDEVVGRYAAADLSAGDYILAAKLSGAPAAENAYLYHLENGKQAVSVTIKRFAAGLSGKLKSGDIVSVLAPNYQKEGATIIPPELTYVEVIGVTASTGYDTDTGGQEEEQKEKELPTTVTLLVLPEQAKLLAGLEEEGSLHLSLVYRGDATAAAAFIEQQDQAIRALHPSSETLDGRATAPAGTGAASSPAAGTSTPTPPATEGG